MAAAKRGAFEMYEAQVHEELSQLVGDSGALHKFLEAALRLENHAFESALGPVSPSLVHLTEPATSYAAPSQAPVRAVETRCFSYQYSRLTYSLGRI